MIPKRLELTNFFSYRDTAVLDFKGIHLAGISGPNGAGKSSIMEAMTWALFGQSRARSDDDLVNRLAGDDGTAEVRFDFELEGTSYRIIRRKQPGKTMILELQMDAGDGSWKQLSEGKLRETQAAIEDLLRMNYETFANASFLLQGKADQFTTKTASQRKDILAELLGVTVWERYRERAAAARKEVEGQIALLDARLEESASELEEEAERREALLASESQHQIVTEQTELKELLLKETLRKEEIRSQQQKNVTEMEERQKRIQSALQRAQATLENRIDARGKLAILLEQEDEISAAYTEWQSADQDVQQHQALAGQYNEILQAMQPHELALAEARSRLEQQLEALIEQAQRVEKSRGEYAALKKEIADVEAELAGLQQDRDRNAGLQKKLEEARAAHQQLIGRRSLWQQELDGLKAQADKINALAEEKADVERKRTAAQDSIESLAERISVIEDQRENYAQLQIEQQALLAQQPSLRREMEQLKERIDTLETAEAGGACPLCDQPLSEDHRQAVLESLREDGKNDGDRYRSNDARLKALAVELPAVEKTLRQAPPLERDRQEQQKKLLQAEARLEEIAKAISGWTADGEKRLVELAALLADKSELDNQSAQLAEIEKAVGGFKEGQNRLQELDRRLAADTVRLAQLEKLISDWDGAGVAKLEATRTQLAQEDFAPEARRELASLQKKLNTVAYDPAAHRKAVSRKQEVAGAPERYQELQKAHAALKPLQEGIDDLQEQVGRQKEDVAEQERQLAEARVQLEALEADGLDMDSLQKDVRKLRQEQIAAAQQVALARQRLDVLDDVRRFRRQLLDEKETHLRRVQRLLLLEKSCGRKGVQALLIEHALPEIEESANLLLERLTGGEMSIRFETQRQYKSRDGLAETLDIIIADRAGQRPYDNYSGGEQFRINFAIRLALSQLLANRAGARLQTLVIDEGFGSQDPQGRMRLVEAINTVQGDFECILVITHVEELREAFPTRIEVQKELNGSQISVS